MPVAAAPPEQSVNPVPVGVYAAAPVCHLLSNTEAQAAFARLRQRLPGTAFSGAQPSEICGVVRVQMAHGAIAYTDSTGRYFLLALALDTHRGSPADAADAVERAVASRDVPGSTE